MRKTNIGIWSWTALLLTAVSLVLAVMSCSDDDDDGGGSQLSVSFRLLNENRQESAIFGYGENIYFDLTLYNQSDNIFRYDERQVLDSFNVFRVYTIDGRDLGTPQDGEVQMVIPVYIAPHSKKNYQTCWLAHESEGTDFQSFPVFQPKEPLAVGDYRSRFKLYLDGGAVECSIDFKVTAP